MQQQEQKLKVNAAFEVLSSTYQQKTKTGDKLSKVLI
jgi:hypothetical protein